MNTPALFFGLSALILYSTGTANCAQAEVFSYDCTAKITDCNPDACYPVYPEYNIDTDKGTVTGETEWFSGEPAKYTDLEVTDTAFHFMNDGETNAITINRSDNSLRIDGGTMTLTGTCRAVKRES